MNFLMNSTKIVHLTINKKIYPTQRNILLILERITTHHISIISYEYTKNTLSIKAIINNDTLKIVKRMGFLEKT